ncbi:MAG: AraC family transcriptional regulator [bacterium]|nr:AraC family transcriptional regulator [bacterium]
MKQQLDRVQKALYAYHSDNHMETLTLFPGITLSFISVNASHLSIHHKALDHVIEINYCQTGRLGWLMENGNNIHLGSGDFSIHTMKSCANSEIDLPTGAYSGLKICIDLLEIEDHMPPLLEEADINFETLYQNFCQDGKFSSFAGNEETEMIFSFFYNQPAPLQFTYYKLKLLELLLYLYKLDTISLNQLSAYRSEQIEIIHKIHEQMILHMNERFTIESLSKQYLMNPTTLKTIFKAVYGNSIAAHIKEHRMEEAARLLLTTDRSVAEIASQVGYSNQSKFTIAFKDYYQYLPKEYRKKH